MPTSPSGAWRPIASVTAAPDVAALGDVAGVAETGHQLRPRLRDAAGVPAELGRLGREAVPGDGRQHQVERVLGASTVRGRVGERADDLEQLDDRARPAVRHDQRQRVLVPRLHVDEVDVHPVDLGLELRQRVQPRLAPAPVVLGRPVAGERLDRRQLHALRAICDELLGRPAHRGDAAAQVLQGLVGNVNVEWASLDSGLAGGGHESLLANAASGTPLGSPRRRAAAVPRRRSGRPCRARCSR